MRIEKIADQWYQAVKTFKTVYNTEAVAVGHGKTIDQAVKECMRDYKIIINL